MIKNIVFDMGNVLLSYNPTLAAKGIFGNNKSSDIIADLVSSSNEWKLLDKGEIEEEQAIQSLCGRNEQYRDMITDYFHNWYYFLTPVPLIYDIIIDLKTKGYKLHLLSNASLKFYDYSRYYTVFNLFDTINISAKMNKVKPNKNIFLEFLHTNNLKASESLFVDDMYENVESAKALGFLTHQFKDAQTFLEFINMEKII